MTRHNASILSYRLVNDAVTIAAPHPEARAALSTIFGGFPSAPPDEPPARYALSLTERGRWQVDVRGARVFDDVSLDDALMGLESEVVTDVLSSHPTYFHLHGGAFLAPSAHASLLLLGASGSGKTTLGLALMARGFLPFADDVVLIDPATLAPRVFGRAFHVDDSTKALLAGLDGTSNWSFDRFPTGYFVPPEWASGVARVQAILFPVRSTGAQPSVLPLSVAETAAALLSYTMTLDRDPRFALAVAARLTKQARGYALVTADLQATADAVAEVVG